MNSKIGFVAFQANQSCRWISVEKKYDQLKENQSLFVLLDEKGQMVYHNIYDYDPNTFMVKHLEESCKESCEESCKESCEESCKESFKESCDEKTIIDICDDNSENENVCIDICDN